MVTNNNADVVLGTIWKVNLSISNTLTLQSPQSTDHFFASISLISSNKNSSHCHAPLLTLISWIFVNHQNPWVKNDLISFCVLSSHEFSSNIVCDNINIRIILCENVVWYPLASHIIPRQETHKVEMTQESSRILPFCPCLSEINHLYRNEKVGASNSRDLLIIGTNVDCYTDCLYKCKLPPCGG